MSDNNDTNINLFTEICESTLIRYKGQFSKYDAKEIVELIFLYFIMLQIMKHEFDTAPLAKDYGHKTVAPGNFDNFRQGGTDLYLLIHALFGKNNQEIISKLKSQPANKILLDRINFDKAEARRWLLYLSKNHINERFDKRFFLKLEQMLKIQNSDYKAIRRLASDWNNIDNTSKQVGMTRLLFALRSKALRSELYPSIKKLAKKNNLQIKNARNPEKEPSSNSLLKTMAMGAAAATTVGGVGAYSIAKGVKQVANRRVKETASAGATSAGGIASIPMPLLTKPISRKDNSNPKKKSKKDK